MRLGVDVVDGADIQASVRDIIGIDRRRDHVHGGDIVVGLEDPHAPAAHDVVVVAVHGKGIVVVQGIKEPCRRRF